MNLNNDNDDEGIGFDISDDDIYVPVAQRRAALLSNSSSVQNAAVSPAPPIAQPDAAAKPQTSKTLLEEAQNVITAKAVQGKPGPDIYSEYAQSMLTISQRIAQV